MVSARIMPRSATAQTAPDGEAPAQSVGHRYQAGDVGSVAGPVPAAVILT
jgi:hypothetical protein